jgi:hypothetical protein
MRTDPEIAAEIGDVAQRFFERPTSEPQSAAGLAATFAVLSRPIGVGTTPRYT